CEPLCFGGNCNGSRLAATRSGARWPTQPNALRCASRLNEDCPAPVHGSSPAWDGSSLAWDRSPCCLFRSVVLLGCPGPLLRSGGLLPLLSITVLDSGAEDTPSVGCKS